MSDTPERTPPERIWLQPHMGHRIDEWTWCVDRINGPDETDPDVEYVRADRVAELEQAVKEIRHKVGRSKYVRDDGHRCRYREGIEAIRQSLRARQGAQGVVKREAGGGHYCGPACKDGCIARQGENDDSV